MLKDVYVMYSDITFWQGQGQGQENTKYALNKIFSTGQPHQLHLLPRTDATDHLRTLYPFQLPW